MGFKPSKDNELLYQPARPDVSLPTQEHDVLALWDERDVFRQTLEKTDTDGNERKPYSFYDGPPFATGLPHYGHLLAGILKDIVPRYWTMRGHHIPRRFGWDCHGLPVEHEINKKLKLSSNKEIYAMGVDKYNEECRSIVQRYTKEWKATVRRIGRWVDMDEPYFTMDRSFMSSVWWVFKQLWDKGLIYKGHKVVPYSTGVSTALSNFEAKSNYKDVQDPAITVALRCRDQDLYFLAWTTTPWTLPSNMGLAVGNDFRYVKVRAEDGRTYVLAESLLAGYAKVRELEVVETVVGADLVGLSYEPLFDFFEDKRADGAFRVVHSDHVTLESGTGIVHLAPAFGEDDYEVGRKQGIPLVCPVDDDGMFEEPVSKWAGVRVKEADPDIIATLKANDALFRHDTLVHAYPFCWRSDTPLIYRAITTWFVRVEDIKERVIAANKTTNWVPEHLRDGRFGNWLENARDWAVSRNRFWGTPLPIWENEDGEIEVFGSPEELEARAGRPVEDLHLDTVSEIELVSQQGGGQLKQTGGVLDCWFESGSMPYAQWGYPQQNRDEFSDGFPADFIAEGLDQTRGWFYTLMVIGTALFDKPPFKNVIVNGLILAEDGKKMSKSLRNYPDPNTLLEEHGADALRLYLIDAPVVKAQELKFSEKGVRDIVRKILLRWWNAYSFFVSYANIDKFVPASGRDPKDSPNVLDRWILSRLHTLIEHTNTEMASYRLYTVVPALLQFIEDLTNTYIRFNREHFWRDGMPDDKVYAYETLHHVLLQLSLVMAPFTPFMSEVMYQNLAAVTGTAKDSVHLERYPDAVAARKHPELESAVARMNQMVLMGRNIREQISVRAKIPLRKLRIIHRDAEVLTALEELEAYVVDELNVQAVEYIRDEEAYVDVTVKADFAKLGRRLGKKMKTVAAGIQQLSSADIALLEGGQPLDIEGESITIDDVEIRRAPKNDSKSLLAHALVAIELDPEVGPDQLQEGLAREVIRRVQIARKNADLNLDDRIVVELACDDELKSAVDQHHDMVTKEVLAKSMAVVGVPRGDFLERADIDGRELAIALSRQG